ncbi:MAG: HU family DNA-binding protein [Bacteroidia bacterium]|nr:HU family DNA-binding protein [Bacteroidia bacterium]
MNNKLLLQDLTDQLAEAGKIKKKEAEEFLRAFFKISEDALFEDGILKINGLGTLKLVLVDARKSVNVSTGEEFEIREHYKVSFIPDADLKNSVNQPYSHLEPVELDGGTESHASMPEKKTATVKEKVKSERTVSTKGSGKNKRSTLGWILFFLLIAILGVWSWMSNDKHRKEDAVKIHEMELIDSLEADATLQDDLAAIEKESATDSMGIIAADDSLEAVVQSVANETGTSKPSASETAQKPVAAKQAQAPVKQVVPVVKTPIVPTKKAVADTKQVTPGAKPTKPVAIAVTPIVKSTMVKTPSKSLKPATKTTPSAPTTEYIATIVMKPGDRLTLLALKYYGDKIFWVYIYQANKNVILKPDNVPTGTTIRIPKPDPKLIDPKNEALVAKAKALQLQYIGAQ